MTKQRINQIADFNLGLKGEIARRLRRMIAWREQTERILKAMKK